MHQSYPWQTKQWHALLTRSREQKLPHALLFTGPKDLGKFTFSQAIAARLLCQTPNINDAPACGTCQSCQWLAAEAHPDLYMLRPEEDGAMIKIEQIRELLTSLQQTAQRSGQQIVILEPAEAMNKAASNALLKVLEEPFGSVIFLLISHQPGTLSATIRSRCQIMDFAIPPVSIALDWLKKQLPTEQNAELLLALAENIPLRALAFAEESRFKAHQQLVDQFIQLNNGNITPLQIAALCAEMSAEQVYEGLCLLLMDITRLQQSPTSPIAHLPYLSILAEIAANISSRKIFSFLDRLLEIKKQLNSKIHLNMLLLWEALFVEWSKRL